MPPARTTEPEPLGKPSPRTQPCRIPHGKECGTESMGPAHRKRYGERRWLLDENLADLSLGTFDLHEIYSGLGDGKTAAAGRIARHQTAGRCIDSGRTGKGEGAGSDIVAKGLAGDGGNAHPFWCQIWL